MSSPQTNKSKPRELVKALWQWTSTGAGACRRGFVVCVERCRSHKTAEKAADGEKAADSAPALVPQAEQSPHTGWRARLVHMARYTMCGVTSRRFLSRALLAIIAAELCWLGLGVVRRLENSYDMAMDAAYARMAEIETRAWVEGLPAQTGGVGISVPVEEEPELIPPEVEDDGSAPPLRPRDVDTILMQEAGVFPDLGDDVEEIAQQTDPTSAPEGTPAQQLSEEAQELDRLIRKGVSALVEGDMRECIVSFEQAIVIDPNHPALLYYYGLAYDKLLNPDKARDYYTRLFRMRDKAGIYFNRAARRLTYGFEQPSAMRGKLAFGPHRIRHEYDPESGEHVQIILPVLLAPGEEIRLEDLYLTVQFFDLVSGRKIEFCRSSPKWNWSREKPTWEDGQEDLLITYDIPVLTPEELEIYGDLKYYGFTAKLYYKTEPLDCVSSPSALILHEQRINARRYTPAAPSTDGFGLLPDDGLAPGGGYDPAGAFDPAGGFTPTGGAEEALPAGEFPDFLDIPES